MIQRAGLEAIESHIRELTDHLISGALRQGHNVVTPLKPGRRGALIALKSRDVTTLVQRLEARGIIVSSRDNNLRVSPHFYNNHQDVEQLLAALRDNRELLV
jgi:selenocysteine lyase/cysteine desulfurase